MFCYLWVYNEPKNQSKEVIEIFLKEKLKEKMEKDLKDFQAMQELKMKEDIDKFINR